MTRFGLVLLCAGSLLFPARGQTPDQKQATIAYLQNLQAADGGFLPAGPTKSPGEAPKSSLRASSAAVRALKYMGGQPRDKTACQRFVQRCFDKTSGGFADHPGGEVGVPLTAVGIMAVVELGLPVEDYRLPVSNYLSTHAKGFEDIRIAAAGFEALGQPAPRAAAWLEQVAALRNPDGTYGQGEDRLRATGGSVALVLRLGGKVADRDHVIRALKAGQRPDGGFTRQGAAGSDLETTYRVLRAFVMLQEKLLDPERCRALIARCRNADGGYGLAPGQPSTAGTTYFASILLHWLKDM
jgi:prenyltransferase beta subunit